SGGCGDRNKPDSERNARATRAHLQPRPWRAAECEARKHRGFGENGEEAMSMLKVDLDLVKKYNVPGPRYTSYPPATHFTNEISPEVFVEKIRANNRTDHGLSLYFHLPFCQTLCWFCGCTTVITTDQKKSGDYLKYLEREMDLMKPLLDRRRQAVQLH